MNLPTVTRGSEDERAVSPVIGVILMVAITVILAAVIAAFVIGIGDDQDSPINAHVSTDVGDDSVTLTVTDPGSADSFVLRGDVTSEIDLDELESTGDTQTLTIGSSEDLDYESSYNIIAIDGDNDEGAGSFTTSEAP